MDEWSCIQMSLNYHILSTLWLADNKTYEFSMTMTHRFFLAKYCWAKQIFKVSNDADLAHSLTTKLTTAIINTEKRKNKNKNIIYALAVFVLALSHVARPKSPMAETNWKYAFGLERRGRTILCWSVARPCWPGACDSPMTTSAWFQWVNSRMAQSSGI